MVEHSQKTLQLPIHEWIAVVVIITFLVMISTMAIFSNDDLDTIETGLPHHVVSPEIDVTIEGAVLNPGTFKIKRGATLQEALDIAQPLSSADLRKIKINKKLRQGQVIKIPEIKMITVYIKGKVQEPIALNVPQGTRLKDILEQIVFNEDVDINKYRKMRYLKDHETIVIK